MSDLWEPCQFNDKSHVYCEPPSKLDAIYDDLLLKVTGNMLVEQKIEVAKMICNQLNENTALREQIAAKDEALRLTLSYWDDIGVKPCWIIDIAKAALGEDDADN